MTDATPREVPVNVCAAIEAAHFDQYTKIDGGLLSERR